MTQPFDFTQYLKIAKLREPEDPALKEAWLRTAISRAYYSLYHGCLRMASANFQEDFQLFEPKGERSGLHERLVQFLEQRCEADVLMRIGQRLRVAKEHRVWADYDKPLRSNISPQSRLTATMRIADKINCDLETFAGRSTEGPEK